MSVNWVWMRVTGAGNTNTMLLLRGCIALDGINI